MKIIRMQNPALTERFHNLKRNLVIPLIMLLLCLSMGACAIDNYSPKVYDESEAVLEIYTNNQEDFSEIALLLKDSDFYSIDRKSIFGPSIPEREKYFTENEYQQLCDFLDLYQPYEIGKSNGSLWFVFLCVNEDAVLYYTEEEGESLERWLDYIGQDCDVIMLKPNWYIGIDPSDVERTQK